MNDGSSRVKLCRNLKSGRLFPLGLSVSKTSHIVPAVVTVMQASVKDLRSHQGTEGEAKRQNRWALY